MKHHLLHRLHAIQMEYGHISRMAMQDVAQQLALPVTQVESVVDFHHFFYREPRGRIHILFSDCTSCGDPHIIDDCCQRLNLALGEVRADGRVSVDKTSCIGMCDQGASALVNGRPMVGLQAERVQAMVNLIAHDVALDAWPAAWFSVTEHVCRSDALLGQPLAIGAGLSAAMEHTAEYLLQQIMASGLRGRGGAGFATGMKWRLCREAEGTMHYVVCNADEGEPGTFKDRMLLTHYAAAVFEGMAIAGYAVGAEQGLLYLRGEYRYLLDDLYAMLDAMRTQHLLGTNILGQGFHFDIAIVVGAGAYICGEESALLESLEQKRGIPRVRPPFPVSHGYQGQPTVVNNVETLFAATHIAARGSAWFSSLGVEASRGTKLLSISGDCARPGTYEYAFGVTMEQVLHDCGASNVQVVQVGGPSGSWIGANDLSRRLSFDDLATGGSVMVFDRQRDMSHVMQCFAHFFAHESCGFCTPCRVGTTLLPRLLDKIIAGHGSVYDVEDVQAIAALMQNSSHCGLGQTAANPWLNMLAVFPDAFAEAAANTVQQPSFDVQASLQEARQLAMGDAEGLP